MLLQLKIYLIAITYFLGALFMVLFPPRNFEPSGAKLRATKSTGDNIQFKSYADQKMVMATVNRFRRHDPEVVKVVNLTPVTSENRTILAVELRSDKQTRKPGILIIGALNPMTWGAPNVLLELSEKLLYDVSYQTPFFNDYDCEKIMRLLLKKQHTVRSSLVQSRLSAYGTHAMIEARRYSSRFVRLYEVGILYDNITVTKSCFHHTYLIPLANPDGVEFTHRIRSRPPLAYEVWTRNESMRLHTRPTQWHKNVEKEAKEKKPACFGTNINRNFAYHWQDDVHKTPPRCCQYYPGPKPFSTAEANAIRKYVDKLGDFINLAIHLHASFSPKKEYILYPWRYSLRTPSNYRTLQNIGEYAARQARLPNGRLYEVHQSSNDERVAGTLSDYLSGVVGIDLVYLVKPYHEVFPNFTATANLDLYVRKSIATILSLVRGWRSSTKQNTLSFFGRDVEF